jgi:predicted nucleotidyltransferase
LSIWDIYNAKDPYERAASISDLVFCMVGWYMLARALRTPVPAIDGSRTGQIIGVPAEEQSSIARAIRGVNIDGEPAVTTIEAFGSRAGGTYRGRPPNQESDLDLFVTLDSDVVNTPDKVGSVRQQLEEIADLYTRAKGLPLQIITEIDAIAPQVKGNLDDTPFVPLDESN